MPDDLTVLKTFGNHIDADLAKSALEAAGIDSMISADDEGGVAPGLWASNGVRLLVRNEDAVRAATILDLPAEPEGAR